MGFDYIFELIRNLQFRQQEFIPKRHIKKINFYSYIFIFGFLFLTLATYLVSNTIYNKKEKKLLTQLEQIEKEEHLSSSYKNKPIDSRIDLINKKIGKEQKISPFIPLSPKVINILSWLNSWPLFVENQNKVEILTFEYELESFPQISNIKKPYVTRIDLKIKIKDQNLANNFKNQLKSDEIIDQKKEIIWNKIDDSIYFCSFHLKNLSLKEVF